MTTLTHHGTIGRDLIIIDKGIGEARSDQAVMGAARALALVFGSPDPELVDPVRALEHQTHDARAGQGLLPGHGCVGGLLANHRWRTLEVGGCESVRALVLDALDTAAHQVGLKIETRISQAARGQRYLAKV